ncbi:MAG: LysR substrate-binding domain-containing protein, partial [Burkholderiaceae bacterium]
QRTVMGFRGMRGTLEQLHRDLHALGTGSAGRLSIGSIMAASPGYLTQALVRLKEHYPAMAVRIEVGTSARLMELLDAGDLDIVIGRVPGAVDGYRLRISANVTGVFGIVTDGFGERDRSFR